MRSCSGCTLCCKLLPIASEKRQLHIETIEAAISHGLLTRAQATATVPDFNKPAGERCPHQRTGKGCAIYERRPFGCRFWNCRWLLNNDTGDLSRPDRSHYVIDITPDYATYTGEDGQSRPIPVIQVWVDRGYPEAWRDPALLAYLERRGRESWCALIRYDNQEAFLVVPPSMSGDGKWHEVHSNLDLEQEHTPEDKVRALGPMTVELRG